jgi:hypothetical protein
MVGHLIGAAKAGASVRESMRQQRWGKRHADEFDGNTLDGANERQIRDHAVRHGMTTLRQSGWQRVLEGLTSVDEVLRIP